VVEAGLVEEALEAISKQELKIQVTMLKDIRLKE